MATVDNEIKENVNNLLTQIYNSGLTYNQLLECASKNFKAESITEYELEGVTDIDFGDCIITVKELQRHTNGFIKTKTDLGIINNITVFLRDNSNGEPYEHDMHIVHDKDRLKVV